MKHIVKSLVGMLLTIVLLFSLIGCGAKENIVATIGSEKVSESLYRIFLWSAQRGIESIVPNVWDMEAIDGQTPEELAKERALTSITYYFSAMQMAKDMGIELSKEEQQQVKESAKQSMADSAAFAEKYNIKQKYFEQFWTYYMISDSVVQKLGESYIPNDEELNNEISLLKEQCQTGQSATITQIYFSNVNELGEKIPEDKDNEVYAQAKEVLEKALAGEDMNELARTYSDDAAVSENNGEYTFTQGDMDQALEQVVFNEAKVGEVYPEIIETSSGYEIVKVLSVTPIDEAALKEKAIKELQTQYAANEITESGEMQNVEKTEQYDNIHIMSLEEEN